MKGDTTAPGAIAEFPQFTLFPGEIQNLIWDKAANLSPGIQFLVPPPRASELARQAWHSYDTQLVPSRQSAVLNEAHLSLACRDARAAVLRHKKAMRYKTILRIPPGNSAWKGALPSMNLNLDLRRDLVCFGGADATSDEIRDVLDHVEGHHVVFSAAKRFAVRYSSGWEVPCPGPFQHDRRCPVSLVGMKNAGRPSFCSRCLARLVERFRFLEEFWLVADELLNSTGELPGGWNGMSGALKKSVFSGYNRTYVSLSGLEAGGRSPAVKEASEVLERIRANMMDPRYARMPWARDVKFGLLTWRDPRHELREDIHEPLAVSSNL
ncbi:hypothetical protein QBC35DRAFT_394159 [Podospora australis]|uniref:Uncharacterized protein n=1 Tax=Podospora australis TaxID=1536484 RepID=A0AAN6WJP4_9PEZI|nr:hypothetical protein QBC35DRAFT_394159 [Podospora australis]